MAVTEEDVRKALEDMLYANLIEIFNAKYGEELLWAGVDLSVAFEAPPTIAQRTIPSTLSKLLMLTV